jgi:hypothetical protein
MICSKAERCHALRRNDAGTALVRQLIVLGWCLAGCTQTPAEPASAPLPMQLSPESTEQLARNIEAARALAADGPVRLIVEIRVRASISPADAAYADAVADSKGSFVRALKASGALLVEPIDHMPLVVVELTAAQIDGLLRTRLVRNVTIDQPRKTQ